MRLRITLTLLFFVALCCYGGTAFAGRYVISYSHSPCKAESMSPLGVYSSRPYTDMDNGACKGHASALDPLGSGSSTVIGGWAKCSGQITATATWDDEGDSNSVPPKSVLITETASATWIGSTGYCDNGLGDPEINRTSEGIHYSIKNNPRESFKLYCSPTAFATAGVVDVSYSLTVQTIKIIVGGTLDDSGVTKTLTGALCSAEVIVEGDPYQTAVTFRNHNWSIGGDIFKQFLVTPGAASGTFIPFDASALTLPAPSWIWNDRNAGANVFCSFEAYAGEDSIGSGQASREVQVLRPTYTFTRRTGGVHYTGGLTNQVKAGGPDFDTDYGIEFRSSAEIPEPFNSSWGVGEIMYGQLTYLNRYTYCQLTDSPGSAFHYRLNTGGYVLDNTWGYEAAQPPFGAMGASDSPAWSLPPLSLRYNVNDAYRMFLMYRPFAGDWIPLAYIYWTWEARGSRPASGYHWPEPIDGSVQAGESRDTTIHPQWTSRYDNSMPLPMPGP